MFRVIPFLMNLKGVSALLVSNMCNYTRFQMLTLLLATLELNFFSMCMVFDI